MTFGNMRIRFVLYCSFLGFLSNLFARFAVWTKNCPWFYLSLGSTDPYRLAYSCIHQTSSFFGFQI